MAKQQKNDQSNIEFEYQRFLDECTVKPEICWIDDEGNEQTFIASLGTGGARDLVAVDERFARYVFDYLQANDRFGQFDKKAFVFLLAEVINLAAYLTPAQKFQLERDSKPNPFAPPKKPEVPENIARLFGEAKHSFAPIQPEEKKIENLPFERKFDLIHLAICALNHLSKTNPNGALSIEYLTKKRDDLVSLATRKGKGSPASTRAMNVNKRDVAIESRWLTDSLSLSEFSIREKVLALLLLMFDSLEVPLGRNKTQIGDFIHSITGNDRQKIKALLVKPTKVKDANGDLSERSIESLCNDLYTVREWLFALGKQKAVKAIDNEIEFQREDLERNQNDFEDS